VKGSELKLVDCHLSEMLSCFSRWLSPKFDLRHVQSASALGNRRFEGERLVLAQPAVTTFLGRSPMKELAEPIGYGIDMRQLHDVPESGRRARNHGHAETCLQCFEDTKRLQTSA
jgi:hypothetical protein